MKRLDLSEVAIIMGAGLLAVGLWWIYPPAALIVVGGLLLVAGVRAAR